MPRKLFLFEGKFVLGLGSFYTYIRYGKTTALFSEVVRFFNVAIWGTMLKLGKGNFINRNLYGSRLNVSCYAIIPVRQTKHRCNNDKIICLLRLGIKQD